MDTYWSIDAPGLDVGGAETLARAAVSIPHVLAATKVDPELWLTRHLDAETVRLLVEAMQVAIMSGQMADEAAWEVALVLEDFQQWLAAIGEGSSR